MNYPDGQEVRVGDRVRLGDDDGGVVVCSIDRDEYSAGHPREQWSYLGAGVMIEFPKYGLIHFVKPDADLALMSRGRHDP
jgi:hypothetical protein